VALRLTLITPAAQGSRAGNRATARRWASLLEDAGHRVTLRHVDQPSLPGAAPDAILALHAWRSHAAIQAWRQSHPRTPLIVVLTGTDVYRFQYSHPAQVYDSLDRADALIGLHDCLQEDVPHRYHAKLHTVHQSAQPLPPAAPAPGRRYVNVLVAGHLREEKDSLRAAYAVRELPKASRLRVVQLGGAHSDDWAEAAREEMAINPRYRWLGDRPHWQVRQWMARAHLMVISSRMEGGANVVSEACIAQLPVIASDIPGNRGLLGGDYQGYYPVENTDRLRECLLKAERDPAWLARLALQVERKAPLFTPQNEQKSLLEALSAVVK